MTVDGRSVANCVLDLADAEGIKLSNLSLQKVMFFCHAWHLVDTGMPLVKTEFEAWQHGPVLQYLYRQFRDFEKRPISGRATAMNPLTGKSEVVPYDFDPATIDRLKRVVTFYGKLEPWDLVDLSHARGGPWDKVFNSSSRINPGMKIPHTSILEFYSSAGDVKRRQ